MYEISTESFVIHLNARNPDVLVALPNMAFQAIKTEKICGLNTMYTSEGVYLSLTKNKDVTKHPKNGADINEIKEILLADIDFVSHTEAVEVNFLMHQECLNLKSTLKLATLRDKEFMTFNMPNGKNIKIYSYMRTLYNATCKPIEKIEISLTNSVSNDSNELCFRDQPVTYTIDKEIKKGYLINDGIIKKNMINDKDTTNIQSNEDVIKFSENLINQEKNFSKLKNEKMELESKIENILVENYSLKSKIEFLENRINYYNSLKKEEIQVNTLLNHPEIEYKDDINENFLILQKLP